jgi:tRNA-2-methylthio-N6-dimethylallyladenosine synthase
MMDESGARLSFPDLLHRMAEVPGLARLRFTTSHPKDLSDELIQCFREIDILCPQFHLPVQSGSDAVLKRMNRKYTIDGYLEKVEKLVLCRPDIALTTDIIVGFPGETDEDFQLTMDLLENVRFHGSFSFKYSDRPGTRSSDFTDKVDERVKSERLARFQKRQDEISLERNRAYLQTVQTILIEAVGPDSFQGRTGTNHIVHVAEATGLAPGWLVDVTIIHAGQHSLQGKTIKLP